LYGKTCAEGQIFNGKKSAAGNTSFGGSGVTKKNCPKPLEMPSPTRCHVCKISWLTPPKKLRSARYFETVLRAVLINELGVPNQRKKIKKVLTGINSGPKILRSCFLHCCWEWFSRGCMPALIHCELLSPTSRSAVN
jgi:hypothetical protein